MTLDIVGIPEMQKCELKYVIHTPGGPVWTWVEHTQTEQWNYEGAWKPLRRPSTNGRSLQSCDLNEISQDFSTP